MILWHFPQVVHQSFKPSMIRSNGENEKEFDAWCHGKTGYPIVDAGMRELNATGFMHNRIRMVVASFMTKHLLIDWRWGEAYFAKKLLDYDLASTMVGGNGPQVVVVMRLLISASSIRIYRQRNLIPI